MRWKDKDSGQRRCRSRPTIGHVKKKKITKSLSLLSMAVDLYIEAYLPEIKRNTETKKLWSKNLFFRELKGGRV